MFLRTTGLPPCGLRPRCHARHQFSCEILLYRLVLAGYQLLDTGRLHPVRERAIRALADSVDYIDAHMAAALGFDTQKELLDYAVSQAKGTGYFLEFGVFSGGTIRHIAKRKRDVTIHGFDSFEGLPEAWSGFGLAGSAFSHAGKLPAVPPNVALHKGWFRDSIPVWLAREPGPVAFIHLDCDLYSSTIEVLTGLRERLQVGTLILFDEYFNYPGWRLHEFKAWQELVTANDLAYDYIG